jgi:hypothetical protein
MVLMLCGFASCDAGEVPGIGVWLTALPARQPSQKKNVNRIRLLAPSIEHAIVVSFRNVCERKRGLHKGSPGSMSGEQPPFRK